MARLIDSLWSVSPVVDFSTPYLYEQVFSLVICGSGRKVILRFSWLSNLSCLTSRLGPQLEVKGHSDSGQLW